MLTVDASVWVAAADDGDKFYEASRIFLSSATYRRLSIYLPAFASLEIACALARKRRDAALAQELAYRILDSPYVVYVQINALLLSQATRSGTNSFLRGADALYAATAEITGAQLISWDEELIQRANAITPSDWLVANR